MPALPAALLSLVPAGYAVLPDGIAHGDLNRDRRPDLALALKTRNEDKLPLGAEAPRRLLLVFFRQPNGQLKRVFASDTAILKRDEGGTLGDPFQQLRVRRGALEFVHAGGSRFAWGYTHRFRWERGAWRLASWKRETLDRLNGTSDTRDCDLLAGLMRIEGFRDVDSSLQRVAKRRFRELRAIPFRSDWLRIAPILEMRTTEARAKIQAAVKGDQLLVAAQFPAHPFYKARNIKGDFVTLYDAKGRHVEPQRSTYAPHGNGYRLTLTYDLKAFPKLELGSGETLLSGDEGAPPDTVIDATLRVVLLEEGEDGKRLVPVVRYSSLGDYPAQIRVVSRPNVTLQATENVG